MKFFLLLTFFFISSFGSHIAQTQFSLANNSKYSSYLPLEFGNFLAFELSFNSTTYSFNYIPYDFYGHKKNDAIFLKEGNSTIQDKSHSRLTKSATFPLKIFSEISSDTKELTYIGVMFDNQGVKLVDFFNITTICECPSSSYYTSLRFGFYVFLWTSQCNSISKLSAQIIDEEGKLFENEIEVFTSNCSESTVYYADIGALSDGGFIITYEVLYKNLTNNEKNLVVFAQVYMENGDPAGETFRIFQNSMTNIYDSGNECINNKIDVFDNHLGIVGLKDEKFIVLYSINNTLKSVFWDLDHFSDPKIFTLNRKKANLTIMNFTYAQMNDSVVIFGCCVPGQDIFYFRVNETGNFEYSSLNLSISSYEYSLTYLQQPNTALLAFQYIDLLSNSTIQNGTIYKFLNNSAVDVLGKDDNTSNNENIDNDDSENNEIEPNNQKNNEIINEETSNTKTILIAVVCSMVGVILLVVIVIIVRKWRAGRYEKYLKASNKETKVFHNDSGEDHQDDHA